MEYVGKLGSLFTSVQSFYNEINPATLSGAIDIVVVEQEDGELACSPFHVRFGKLSLLMPQEKKIVIKVNGQTVPYFMKVGEAGESFFVFETEHEVPEEFQTSPIVGAVNESKTDEEPPFLDIGESKNQVKVNESESDMKEDQFEDDNEDIMKLPLPAELQSPKMIIEEQMDKVVTNMEHYTQHQQHYQDERLQHAVTDQLNLSANDKDEHDNKEEEKEENDNKQMEKKSDDSHILNGNNKSTEQQEKNQTIVPQNNVYPTDDGSTLLERVIPEAITTTTIAKETFIVRPANGDIYSKIMDVSHQSVQKRDDYINSDNIIKSNKKEHDTSTTSTAIAASSSSTTTSTSTTSSKEKDDKKELQESASSSSEQQQQHNNESIVLDIAGYKTDENKWEEKEQIADDEQMILSKLQTESEMHDTVDRQHTDSPTPLEDMNATTSSQTTTIIDGEEKEKNLDTSSTQQQPSSPTTETPSKSLWGWGIRRKLTNDSLQSTTKSNQNSDNEDDDDNDSVGTDSTKGTEVSTKGEEKDTLKKYQLVPGTIYRVEMSLCGFSAFGSNEKENANVFEEHQITYDTFMHNPNLLNDKRLVFRYENRYYAAGNTGPLFTSLLLYKKPLQNASSDGQDGTSSNDGTDSRESYLFGKGWRQWLSRSSVAAAPTSTSKENEQKKGTDDQHKDEGEKEEDEDKETTTMKGDHQHNMKKHEDITTTFTTTTKTTTVGWNADHEHKNMDGSDLDHQFNNKPKKNYAKTLRLTSEQLKHLKLNKGVNTISFSVTSAYQGTATCAAKIFYWDYDVSVVISDIDGTITKSDTLGHVFTMIGKDWTHNGVAKLYTDICNNGYKILYLTSRAIGQADYTRDYLKKVEQDKYQLPDGPVIMSPDRLFTSFHREVIMRKPEAFKMACLKDILRLFGEKHNPFIAGFGNRITDAISYRSVGVPSSRIFTIDPYGDVKLELVKGFTSSYIHLNDLVDQMFPPLNPTKADTDLEYNDWNFWKQPLPEIDLPELDSSSLSQPTSPKPKPIKPDLTSLPNQAVVTIEKKPSRSLLRSFTSMSSSSTSSLSSIDHHHTSTPTSPRHLSPPLVPTSSSSTDLTTSSSSSGSLKENRLAGNNNRSRVSSFTTSIKRPSLLGGGNNNDSATVITKEDGKDRDEEHGQPPESPTSSGIMNNLLSGSIGGVRNKLSRTFAYGNEDSTIQEENTQVDKNLKQIEKEKDDDEKEEDDEYDMDDIDCDMDDIPFI